MDPQSPKRTQTNDQPSAPDEPVSDLDFADELDNLLLRLRGICEVVKWTMPEALHDSTNPLANTMEVVTDLLDEAKALADRWYHARHPDGRHQASRGES
ncbi:MAG: hypothetical protein ACRERE_04670 [Candidatus Entotheonellia bacterium]